MRIALATDAWHPQLNGVVRCLSTTAGELRRIGHQVDLIEPSLFRTMACPTYPEIRLALGSRRAVGRLLDAANPDAIHIATEGPVGQSARSWCLRHGRAFTTSFHTRFPDYVAARSVIPASWVWAMMRRFHRPAERTFVCTRTLAAELRLRGIASTFLWPLGVDLAQFTPDGPADPAMIGLPRPIMVNVGRVAVEKNIEAFLECAVAGSKVVVGDGPALAMLKVRHPDVLFLGPKHGAALAAAYRAADVFVFPSRTDTFGLVNLEALACGVPVAAYPVAGPVDILGADGRGVNGGTAQIGALDEDLAAAIARALMADRRAAVREAAGYQWDRCTRRFVAGLAVRDARERARAA